MSIYSRLQNDCSTLIQGLAMTPSPNIVVRNVMQVFELDVPGIKSAPLILIVVHKQKTDFEAFEGQIEIFYRVWIGIYYLGNQKYETEFNLATTRDAIRQALHITDMPTATLDSSPCGVWDSDVDMRPDIFDEKAAEYNLDFSAVEIIYKSAELRNEEIG